MTGLRSGLHGAAFLALGITLGAGTGGAAEVDGPMLNWDIALIGPSRSVTVIFEETAKRLEQATDGKFKIKLHYNAQLAPEKEILDGLSVGAFQLGWVVPGYAPGKLVTASALDLPFLPAPDARALVSMSHAYLQIPETVADFGRWGTRYIHTVPLPVYEFMGKGKAPQTVADFKGQRLRMIGGLSDVMRSAGAVPTNFPVSDIFGALERNMLDGVTLAYNGFQAYRMYEICTWYSKGIALSPPASLFVGNLKALESLPPQYATLLRDAAATAAAKQIDTMMDGEDKAEAVFKQKGVQQVNFPAAERDKLIAFAQPIWDKWVHDVTPKGIPGQKLLDFILDTAKKPKS